MSELTTIDDLIAKLQEAKKIIGGDAGVCFWRDYDGYLVVPVLTLGAKTSDQVKLNSDTQGYLSLQLEEVRY